jgi:pyruvate dehydrogenase E2 component (dihydrolipoamide acetyltransferase)
MADVTLPQLGETVTEGTITRWFKAIGDSVAADEPLFEVSTDKVDTEVPSPVAGTLTEIRAQEGDTVPVGAVIAVVGGADATAAAAPEPTPAPAAAPEPVAAESTPPAVQAPVSQEPDPAAETAPAASVAEDGPPAPGQPTASEPTTADAAGGDGDSRLLSPVVRRLVAEHGINPDDVTGTGPGGRITRDDVLDHIDKSGGAPASPPATAAATPEVAAPAPAAAAAPPAAPPSPAPAPSAPAASAPKPAASKAAAVPVVAAGEHDSTVKLTKIRKLTGAHMIMSKAVTPHAFSVVEVDFANVDRTRNTVKNEWKKAEGFSLTYLPFITRAVVDALGEFAHLNASLGENEIVVHNFIDIGIAVDLDYQGLIVPVVRAAETKRLRAIAREISDLAARAHSKKLSPDEISGGTFTISNNGSAGSVLTMPIINQPQVAILSTDAIVRKPVVANLPDGGEAIVIHPVGKLAMAWDHRVFDGAYAAGFLVKVKQILETRDWSAEL